MKYSEISESISAVPRWCSDSHLQGDVFGSRCNSKNSNQIQIQTKLQGNLMKATSTVKLSLWLRTEFSPEFFPLLAKCLSLKVMKRPKCEDVPICINWMHISLEPSNHLPPFPAECLIDKFCDRWHEEMNAEICTNSFFLIYFVLLVLKYVEQLVLQITFSWFCLFFFSRKAKN